MPNISFQFFSKSSKIRSHGVAATNSLFLAQMQYNLFYVLFMYCPLHRKPSLEQWLEAQAQQNWQLRLYPRVLFSQMQTFLRFCFLQYENHWVLRPILALESKPYQRMLKFMWNSSVFLHLYHCQQHCLPSVLCAAQSSGKLILPCFQLQRNQLLSSIS